MKSPPFLRPRANWLQCLIQDATGATVKDLAQIENIMCQEIFHSTLDWQSQEQLVHAARQAFSRLNEDRELYHLDYSCRMAMVQKMRVESVLRDHNTPANRAAVADAQANYEAARTKIFPRLDETKTI